VEGVWRGKGGATDRWTVPPGVPPVCHKCAKVCHRCATLAHRSYCQVNITAPEIHSRGAPGERMNGEGLLTDFRLSAGGQGERQRRSIIQPRVAPRAEEGGPALGRIPKGFHHSAQGCAVPYAQVSVPTICTMTNAHPQGKRFSGPVLVSIVSTPHAGRLEGPSDRLEFDAIRPEIAPVANYCKSRRSLKPGSWSRPISLPHRSPKLTLTGFGNAHGNALPPPAHECAQGGRFHCRC